MNSSAPPEHSFPSEPVSTTGYSPLSSDAFDEMAVASGQFRPHWQAFLNSFLKLSGEDLAGRWENAQRMLRDHGVTYNVYRDAQGAERPWQLDLVPFLISPREWQQIEAGLIQRTRLLNAILNDIYGERLLIRNGDVPPALIYANPSFLRPCWNIPVPNKTPLMLHAVDLVRSSEGQWEVLCDRTQAPSGTGYALENRIVLSRVLPDEFRDCNVHRLASFFQAQQDGLRALASLHKQHPNIVLLTPGPHNETYFEHAYLARYLGFPLVEGGDLTVRDRKVFIKTLEGLQPVDVILRRVDDTFCDPLELRPDSHLGVPGLAEAARAGNVAIANALGCGVAESPGLLPFLDRLCRTLLGEQLKLPNTRTWWCGEPESLDHVLKHLDDLVIKRAFSPGSGMPMFGSALTQANTREGLLDQIRIAPQEFAAQEHVGLSTIPVLGRNGLEPRHMVLRTYICACGDSFVVMPGGLTRVPSPGLMLINDAKAPDNTDEKLSKAAAAIVTMQSGGRSKDTWVLSDGPVSTMTLLKPVSPVVRLERTAAEVPSRVADNLFWLGRYAERLEDTVRILRCVITPLIGETDSGGPARVAIFTRLLVRLDLLPHRFLSNTPNPNSGGWALEKEMLLLIYQASRLGTVREVLGRLRHIASVVRDRLSADTWRIVNKLQVDALTRPGRVPLAESLNLLNTLIVDLAAFSGMEMENMTRGHHWRFLDLGRRIERALNILTLIQASLAAELEGEPVLDALLEIGDSAITYRRRYFAQPQFPGVLDLLLLDETNPRSFGFQIKAVADHVANLPGTTASVDTTSLASGARDRTSVERRLDAVTYRLASIDAESPTLLNADGLNKLNVQLADMAAELRGLSEALTHHYFSHADFRLG